ncbi:methyltransferase, FxLD system [Actinocorallia sp. A-T 12471]|uniref:methyltransferase, FxLD system n=1 Tax=Actinocorallia sp. A-T 12471 TaxID=3089813 RepID=UPI0029CD880B|nr:methyltransferase, FxLD system [Actinocorallia sp. A-T 12471]MDX6741443.1 methyltransferase, FxLD system [Actinocorallia sp. A-T 12471]
MSVDELRNAMVEGIAERTLGMVLGDEIRRALLAVPRHVFAEDDADVETAYRDVAIVTKRDEERGINTSSVSAPWLQAVMLGQAGLKPGDRVLEVGSGGYNAALIREIVGAAGSVTTLDIDPDISARAVRCLGAAGYDDVEVVCADAEFALHGDRTFDAIIVTVGAWDVPPAWSEQLAADGRLVVPIRMKGLTRSWLLERQGDVLVSRGHVACGFVPMMGAGEHVGTGVPVLEEPRVSLWMDELDSADAGQLAGVLDLPRAETWTDVLIDRDEVFSDQDLWLAATLPGFALVTCSQEAIDQGVVALPWQCGTPAFVDGPTLAYRPKPRQLDDGRYEFGAFAHGSDAHAAARLLAEQIAAWDRAGRPEPRLSVYPLGTPDVDLPDGFVLTKRHSRLVISWPSAR